MAKERLRDGSEIELRPIRPDDRAGLAEAVSRMSPESRYRRFFSAGTTLSQAELRYLTDIDHHDHEALVAVEPETRRGIGVARFVRLDDPKAAELALAVADDWQGRGLGTLLLTRLTERARAEGVERFHADVLAENEPMLHLINELGDARKRQSNAGSLEIEVELPPDGVSEALATALKAAARGALSVRNP